MGVDQSEAFQRIFRFQDALGVRDLHAHIGGDEIRQTARILHALQHGQHVRRGQAAQGEHLFALLARGAQERFHRGVDLGSDFGQSFNARFQIGVHLAVAGDPRAAYALHQNFHPRVRHLEHAHDLDHGAHVIKVRGRGIVGAFLALGADQQMPSVFQGGFHGLHGFFAADEQRQDHIIEYDHVAHRQHGQHVGNALGSGVEIVFVQQILHGRFFLFRMNVVVDGGLGGAKPLFPMKRMIFFFVVSHIYSP